MAHSTAAIKSQKEVSAKQSWKAHGSCENYLGASEVMTDILSHYQEYVVRDSLLTLGVIHSSRAPEKYVSVKPNLFTEKDINAIKCQT